MVGASLLVTIGVASSLGPAVGLVSLDLGEGFDTVEWDPHVPAVFRAEPLSIGNAYEVWFIEDFEKWEMRRRSGVTVDEFEVCGSFAIHRNLKAGVYELLRFIIEVV